MTMKRSRTWRTVEVAGVRYRWRYGRGTIDDKGMLAANLAKITRLAGAAEITRREKVDGAPAVVTALGTLFLDLASTVDAGAEKIRLTKELDAIAKHLVEVETIEREGFEKLLIANGITPKKKEEEGVVIAPGTAGGNADILA